MSGMAETFRRRAGWLAAAGLFLAGNAGFFLWYRATGGSRQEALEERRAALTSEVGAAERDAERLRAQRRRLSQISAAIGEFYGKRVGTRKETLAPIIDEIHAILRRVGVSPGQIGYAIRRLQKLPLSEMTASFSFAGDYGRFKRLVDAFEASPRWIVVRDIALARQQDVPGGVQVRMTLATYFAEPAREETPAAPAGALEAAAARSRP